MQQRKWRQWFYAISFSLTFLLTVGWGQLPLVAQDQVSDGGQNRQEIPSSQAAVVKSGEVAELAGSEFAELTKALSLKAAGSLPAGAIAQATLVDINNHWAQDCIRGLAQRRMVSADSRGYFRPDAQVSWQELTQVLNLMFPTGQAASWANPLEKALGLTSANVASHYPDHYYVPGRSINRAEALMAMAAKVNGSFLTRANATLEANLTDAEQIPQYAREGVASALTRQLVVDYPAPRQLRPNDLITRGEVAAMLCRASADPELKALVPAEAIATFQLPAPATVPATERRGVWITNIDSQVLFTSDALVAAVDRLADLNFNTLYPTVWNWGYTLYPSAVAEAELGVSQHLQGESGPPRGPAPERDMLQEIIDLAHARDMQVLPWFEFGFMTPAPYRLYDRHPDWFTQKYAEAEPMTGDALPGSSLTPDPGIWMEGGAIPRRWLNPFHPEAQQFLLSLLDEQLTRYDIDGIQVDDHLGLPVEFGYDDYTVRLYTQETGAPPPLDPQEENWVQWRADKISGFMDRVHQLVQARRPGAKVSVSPNPYPFSYANYLQDWPEWQRRGAVDELVVQIYRNDQNRFIWEMTKPSLIASQARMPTSVGILSGLRALPVSMPWIRAQVDAVRDRNLAGVSFFFYETLWLGPEPMESRTASLRDAFLNPASPP